MDPNVRLGKSLLIYYIMLF